MTNSDLRTSYQKIQLVILVERGGTAKYIAKSYGNRKGFDYTVLLNKARKFDTIDSAMKFGEDNHLHRFIGFRKVQMNLSLLR